MKCLLLLPMLMALVAAETYSTENDDLDIEAVVGDLNTLKSFMDCFNDKKPCDAVQADFKKDLPEAFQNACAKCTAAQKHIFKRFLEESEKKVVDDLNALKKKYDPESKHYAALLSAISKS
ncbi:PREDICTED: ejaculatory bulb-specific protein 3-like [Papilio xuthus]|uniref:Chemosensory protein 11b n=1 Tax=Papilio xuthus TaxID=66420 RepID=B5U9X1_PAPXU|nr:ejaculatory bulb-specific protein 3-like precursor [Papilio xuthus]XP_013162584.1 PREDICTED: ejaculatory bulb-specific protein 3-like [Papilio xuthus]KPJ05766.1 Putative odorant-binding protein A10 [Papilio xuthus]BAG71919.1 chemosensory protein 11b [Papilio xuthus]BAM17925.1 unknown secreted protein [Papilio xuthus]